MSANDIQLLTYCQPGIAVYSLFNFSPIVEDLPVGIDLDSANWIEQDGLKFTEVGCRYQTVVWTIVVMIQDRVVVGVDATLVQEPVIFGRNGFDQVIQR